MDLIRDWREQFDLETNGSLNRQQIRKFTKLLIEEVCELLDELWGDQSDLFSHIRTRIDTLEVAEIREDIDVEAVLKEFVDIQYILKGEGEMALGLSDALKLMQQKTYLSNLSKLIDTEEEAISSCLPSNRHLKEKDIEFVSYRQLKNGKYQVYNKKTGKILKGINYKSIDHFDKSE